MNTNLHSCIIGESLLCEDIVAYFNFKWHENLICYTDGYADQHIPSINTLMSLDSAEIGMTSNGLRYVLLKYYFLKTTLFSFYVVKLTGTVDTRKQYWTCFTQYTTHPMLNFAHSCNTTTF